MSLVARLLTTPGALLGYLALMLVLTVYDWENGDRFEAGED